MQLDVITPEPGNTRGWPKTQRQLDWAILRIQEGLSAHAASIKAGYSKRYSQSKSCDLDRSMAPFLAYLQERKNKVAETEYDVTTRSVIRGLSVIAFANPQDYVRRVTINGLPRFIGKPIDALSENAAMAVKSWTVEPVDTDEGPEHDYQYVLYNKRSSLVDLGKHLGMFNDKILVEMNHRHAHSHRLDFSAVPTDELAQIIKSLEQFKEKAKPVQTVPKQR